MINTSPIQALVALIDDPDDSIFLHVRDRLLQYGEEAIPYLENSWEENDFGLIFQTRIETLIHEIQFESVRLDLKEWLESPDKNLLEGACIVARYQYPELEVEEIKNDIANIRKDIWLEINSKQTSFELVKTFNHVFFQMHGFKGETKNFHSPLNSYINTVLESRRGNPLSLCLIYSILAQSLDIPVYGVNLPNHFILAYMDQNMLWKSLGGTDQNDGILFYINPFSKGTLLQRNEIEEFLQKLNIAEKKEFFEPCPNTAIIKRMLTNLITAFSSVGNREKTTELTQLRDLFK